MLDLLIGSTRKNAQREYNEGNYDPTTGEREKSFGDTFGEFLTGRGAATDEAVKKLYVEDLKEKYGSKLDALRELPGVSIPEITARTKKSTLSDAIARYKPQLDKLNEARTIAATAGLEPSEVSGLTSNAILSKVAQTREGKEKGETERLELRADKQAADARLERLQERLDARRERTADRQAERELKMFEMKQNSSNRKAELFQALFGLGSAFMI